MKVTRPTTVVELTYEETLLLRCALLYVRDSTYEAADGSGLDWTDLDNFCVELSMKLEA